MFRQKFGSDWESTKTDATDDAAACGLLYVHGKDNISTWMEKKFKK